jgi:hypothetical protein
VFSGRSHFQQNFARTIFKQGLLFRELHQEKQAEDAISMAYQLLQKFAPQKDRSIGDLSEADFDNIVMFWSR